MRTDIQESLIFSKFPAPEKSKRIFGLGAKVTLLLLGGLIILTAVTTWFSVKHLRASLRLGLEEMADALGRVVGIASAYQGFYEIDTRKLNQYIDSAANQPDVAYAAILDRRGKVVVQRGLNTDEVRVLEKGEELISPQEIFQEVQDIKLDPPVGKIGSIVIGISKVRINQGAAKIISTQVLVAAIVAVISLSVLWGVVISITKPLRKLTEQTRRIGEGVLDQPVEVKSRDEVGQLAESIEQMRIGLHRNMKKLSFLGKLSHRLNSVLNLEETIVEVRENLANYPFWEWHEFGLVLVRRGIPNERFHYYPIFPPPPSNEKLFTPFSLERTIIALALETKKLVGQATFKPVTDNDFSFYLQEKEIQSSVAAPLIIKKNILGALYAGFRDDSGRSSEVQEIVQNIADDLASVIEGIYLIEDLRFNLKQLKRAHQELKSLDNLKTEFISGVSHELRTPLVSITGYMHMMVEEKLGKITDLQREGLETSVKSLDRLTNLIEKMLTFSSEQQIKEELPLTNLKIESIIDHCLATVKTSAQNRNVELRSTVEENLPLVRVDEDKIIQVVINLLDNAIKFSEEGGKVEIKARRPFKSTPEKEGKIEVLVRDRGQGIAKKDLPHIFEKFWQAHREEGYKYTGIGLGLSLVKKILRQHGCDIEVESELGKGSTFVFTLPLTPEKWGPSRAG